MCWLSQVLNDLWVNNSGGNWFVNLQGNVRNALIFASAHGSIRSFSHSTSTITLMSPVSLLTSTSFSDLNNGVMWNIVIVLVILVSILVIGIILGSSGLGQHMGQGVTSMWQRFHLRHRPSSPPPRTSMQLPIQTTPPPTPPRPSSPIPIPPPSHSAASFDTFGIPTHGQRWRP